jgi:hypothetical protein
MLHESPTLRVGCDPKNLKDPPGQSRVRFRCHGRVTYLIAVIDNPCNTEFVNAEEQRIAVGSHVAITVNGARP